MKVKTSITLSAELIREVDRRARRYSNRSEFIETAVSAFIARLVREEKDKKDLEILNRCADCLNQEAADALAYQARW